MKQLKNWRYLLILPLLVLGSWSFSNDERYFELAKNIDIFASLYSEVNKYYVDEVNPNTLINTSIEAMLKKLDPYTVYIPEDDIEDFRTNSTGQYGGIGIMSNRIGKRHLVLNLYEGSPASEAGIKIGDEIVSIDGKSIVGMADDEVGKLIKGQSGTSVKVGVKRNKKEQLEMVVDRKKITIPNIGYQTLLDDSIGYFKLSEFTRSAAEDVEKSIKELKEQGATQLIFDLRGNPGGLLNEAVAICNLFISKGSKIVETRGKTEAQSLSYVAERDPLDLDIPLTVLVDNMSASASEIVSGVMQDHDRGVIIGQKSYGKGLVQVTRPLSYNSQLKVTTAKYYIPSGRCIQALDYQHKDINGQATEIPDSLKKAFFTANSRVVYDGGGVDPDIKVSESKNPSFVDNLIKSGIIFDFATQYYYKHPSIKSATDFSLSDQEYDTFVGIAKKQGFENHTDLDNAISLLTEASNEDKVYVQLSDEIAQISKDIKRMKANGFSTFKKEIKRNLEIEIVRRYYFNKGVLEATLNTDKDVIAAKEILASPGQYKQLLRN